MKEPKILVIDIKSANIALEFPLVMLQEKDTAFISNKLKEYQERQELEQNKNDFPMDILALHDLALQKIMQDCVAYFGNKRTKAALWLQENFINTKHYDVFDIEKSLQAFKNICWLSPQEAITISDYYFEYLEALRSQNGEINKKHEEEIKALEKEDLGKEERQKKREELLTTYESELVSTAEALRKEYSECLGEN